MLLYYGNVEMDTVSIRQKTLSGRYEIKWNEVKQVEFRQPNPDVISGIVFRGQNKVLSILGPLYWQSEEIESITKFIISQSEAQGVEIIEAKRSFRFLKNTRL